MSTNTDGKTFYQCSCGYKTYLDNSEVVDWMARHSAMFNVIQHKLTEIKVATQEDVNAAILAIAQSRSNK